MSLESRFWPNVSNQPEQDPRIPIRQETLMGALDLVGRHRCMRALGGMALP